MKHTTEQAVKSLEKFIKKNWGENPPDKVKVYHYKERGFRIAEISAVWGDGVPTLRGCSWMRSECSSLILASEEFILTYGMKPYRPPTWESYIDVHDDAKCHVRQHMK